MTRESQVIEAPPATSHASRWLIATPFLLAALVVAASMGAREVSRWLIVVLPSVASVDVYAVLFDVTPVPVTITAGRESIPLVATRDALLSDSTIWRRMHVADWNKIPIGLRRQGLDAMVARYRHLLFAPAQWERMTPHDWDRVPQPVRALAYRHMVEYWSGVYAIAPTHELPSRLVRDTLAAIVMSESWFDHRGLYVNVNGSSDIGLAGASAFARERLRQLHARGVVDVAFTDEDYYNPWMATRFVAVWMSMLLDRTAGDLDFAVRAYNRGLANAFDELGDRYLAAVRRRLNRFMRNNGAPPAWDYLWNRDREARLEAWPLPKDRL